MNRSKIADLTWQNKYAAPGETALDHTYMRVAKALTVSDEEYELLHEELFTNRFIPAGRIFAAAGLDDRKVTYLNCFTSGVIPDSIQGIFDTITEAAVTQKY
jgi:ribonucleoside-diphosphate reductase alpha chain